MTFSMAEGPTASQLSMAFPTAVYTHMHKLNVCFLNIYAVHERSHSSSAVYYKSHSVLLIHVIVKQAACGETEKKNCEGSTYDDATTVFTVDAHEPPLYMQN